MLLVGVDLLENVAGFVEFAAVFRDFFDHDADVGGV